MYFNIFIYFRYSAQNENGLATESSSSSNIASSTAPGPLTESEPSVVTACTSGPSCSSLDTTTHSNNTQRKRKADLLVTSYVIINYIKYFLLNNK
jgi:nucleoprotein TPR